MIKRLHAAINDSGNSHFLLQIIVYIFYCIHGRLLLLLPQTEQELSISPYSTRLQAHGIPSLPFLLASHGIILVLLASATALWPWHGAPTALTSASTTSLPALGGPRSCFLCTSDGVRRVLVAGGYTRNNVMRRSVMTYDVEEDRWEILPDTAERPFAIGAVQCVFS